MTLDERMRVLLVRMQLDAERWPVTLDHIRTFLSGGRTTEAWVTAIEKMLNDE